MASSAPTSQLPEPLPATVTPEWLAHNLLVEAGVGTGMGRVRPEWLLDPCAGTGTILKVAQARHVPNMEFVELNQARAVALRDQGFTGRHGDMRHIEPIPQATHVVMNPDFRKEKWVGMVTWAKRLAPNASTLVSLVPSDWYCKWHLADWPTGVCFKDLLATTIRIDSIKVDHPFEMEGKPVPVSILRLTFRQAVVE